MTAFSQRHLPLRGVFSSFSLFIGKKEVLLQQREHHNSPSGSESFTLTEETGAVLLLSAAERNNCVYVELLSMKISIYPVCFE